LLAKQQQAKQKEKLFINITFSMVAYNLSFSKLDLLSSKCTLLMRDVEAKLLSAS